MKNTTILALLALAAAAAVVIKRRGKCTDCARDTATQGVTPSQYDGSFSAPSMVFHQNSVEWFGPSLGRITARIPNNNPDARSLM